MDAEMVPIEHETSERVARWMFLVVPPAALTLCHFLFPTSARHGLSRWQLDPGAWLIAALERCHLAWDVIRITPERLQGRLEASR